WPRRHRHHPDELVIPRNADRLGDHRDRLEQGAIWADGFEQQRRDCFLPADRRCHAVLLANRGLAFDATVADTQLTIQFWLLKLERYEFDLLRASCLGNGSHGA